MIKLKDFLNEEDCGCGGHNTCGCEITESVADASKVMYDLSDRLDSDPLNQKLSTKLKNSYKNNVTTFMRDVVSVVKDVK